MVISEKNSKAFGINRPFDNDAIITWPPTNILDNRIYLSCGSSDNTQLNDKSVDLVITDPPFFDNVHYSELADFFYSWNDQIYGYHLNGSHTTRSKNEVQDTNPDSFSLKLMNVFAECQRILKKKGLLIFSYHHSKKEGWSSVAKAVVDAGFSFIQSHPVKAEMSVASPKLQAKSPIDYDIILVCAKREDDVRDFSTYSKAIDESKLRVQKKLDRLRNVNLKFSHNDVAIITNGELLKSLSPGRSSTELLNDFDRCNKELTDFISSCYRENER